MNKTNVTFGGTKDASKLVRAKFGPGMLLQHEDLGALNDYTRELSRLMFRSLFGCGVICGLVVNAEVDKCNKVVVTVDAGLALDCAGDPVHVPKDQRFALDENCDPDINGPLWVVLCGTTKHCAPRTSMCTDDDQPTSVCTRERDMFEIRVVSARPKCACGCAEPSNAPSGSIGDQGIPIPSELKGSRIQKGSNDPCLCADPSKCHADHYAGTCGCNCGDGSNCDCDCILLARLDKAGPKSRWTVDHSVRRFIRPVLMRDPRVEIEKQARKCELPTVQQPFASGVGVGRELRVASRTAADAADAADKATDEAKVAAAIKVRRLAAAEVAENLAAQAKVEAETAQDAADTLKAAASRAVPGNKTAANKAAAEADRAAKRLKVAANKTAALAKDATAEAEKANVEAEAAEAAARKAERDRLAAYRAVADATDKAERFISESMPSTDR